MKAQLAPLALPRFEMTIAGEAAAAESWLDVIDPATGNAWAQVPRATTADIDRAVASSRAAFGAWSGVSLAQRRIAIELFLAAIEERAADFARILHHERGGPLHAGVGEVRSSVRFCTAMLDQYPETLPADIRADITIVHHRKPWGVIGAITPWNFPLQLVLVKLVPALLCGNSIMVKPSPLTPVTALLLGEIARDCLPAGLVNVVTGDNSLGPVLTGHTGIAKISFTGSTRTGRRVLEATAGTLKRVTLELGGNDAAIVTADADPIAAANALGWLAYANNGQICLAVKRIYVHESLHAAFCSQLAAVADGIHIGPQSDESVNNGPVQNAAQFARISELLADAVANGGRVIAGGTSPAHAGYFLRPTVVADADDAMRLVHEEQFGPVIPVMSFTDVDDAIRRANATEFGLGSSVWSNDIASAEAISRRLEAGVTWINQHGFPDPRMPLAGAKQSGIGVEFASDGIAEYTRLQVENIATSAANWFAPSDRSPDSAASMAGQAYLHRVSLSGQAAAKHFTVIDPADGTVVAVCAATSPAALDAAVARAHGAFPAWRDLPAAARRDHLRSRRRRAWLPSGRTGMVAGPRARQAAVSRPG